MPVIPPNDGSGTNMAQSVKPIGTDGTLSVNGNIRQKKVEPLVSVDKLRSVYLFGIDIFDNNGLELPEATYQQYIDNAVSALEHYLDISILPQDIVEEKDYHFNDYYEWGYFQLNNWPVIRIDELQLSYFREDINTTTLQPATADTFTIPAQWIRVDKHDGIIRLIPNARFPGNLQLSGDGYYYPYTLFRSQTVPNSWIFKYVAGFEAGKIPVAVNQVIAYMAAIQALIIGGNLVLGAGIASSSLSIDGLSQSINTTQSAENSAYSATIKDYQQILYGANERERGLIRNLYDFYKGEQIHII